MSLLSRNSQQCQPNINLTGKLVLFKQYFSVLKTVLCLQAWSNLARLQDVNLWTFLRVSKRFALTSFKQSGPNFIKLVSIKLDKHSKILLLSKFLLNSFMKMSTWPNFINRNWLPAKITWSLHCCNWCPTNLLLTSLMKSGPADNLLCVSFLGLERNNQGTSFSKRNCKVFWARIATEDKSPLYTQNTTKLVAVFLIF